MDPLSAGASVLGSIGSIFSANKQLKAQREENEKNRKFNAEQASLSRQYNTQMVNAQNLYNDPSNVMRRLQAAGINPSLAYSQGSGSVLGSVGVGSTSQQASSSNGVSPVMPDFSGIQNSALMAAQIKLLNAQAKKVLADTNTVEMFNIFQPKLLGNEVTIGGQNIKLLGTKTAQGQQEIIESQKRIEQIDSIIRQLDAETENIKAAYEGIDAESFEKKINAFFALPRGQQQMQLLAKQIDCTDAQAKQLIALTPYLINLYQSQSELFESQKEGQDNSNVYTKFQADIWKMVQHLPGSSQIPARVLDNYFEYLRSAGVQNYVAEKGMDIQRFNAAAGLFVGMLQAGTQFASSMMLTGTGPFAPPARPQIGFR